MPNDRLDLVLVRVWLLIAGVTHCNGLWVMLMSMRMAVTSVMILGIGALTIRYELLNRRMAC